MKTSNHNRNSKDLTLVLTLFDACLSFGIVVIAGLYMAFLYTGVVWPVSLQGQELLKSWGIGSKSIFIAAIWLETIIPAIVAIPVTYRISKKSKLLATISTAITFWTIIFTESAMYSLKTELVVKNLVLYPMIGWTMGILIAKVLTSLRHAFSKPTQTTKKLNEPFQYLLFLFSM